ncbi:hypothetical protein [Nocardia sp. NPDC051463]|uniref:hypothetical protein n=1 Tax=Nocardia sp. NPDC051463 TaxID=3154845 RepID=UPI00345072F2
MSDDICEINEMPKAWCAHCLAKDLPKPPPLDWFPARYDGKCCLCFKPIEVGDDIASTEDGYICRRRHDDY